MIANTDTISGLVTILSKLFDEDYLLKDNECHQIRKAGYTFQEILTKNLQIKYLRVLSEDPVGFFTMLLERDILHILFPEIYRLLTATESIRWHPEGNAFEHTMLVLEYANDTYHGEILLALSALYHDIGKGRTPRKHLPKHYGHAEVGARLVPEYLNEFVSEEAIKIVQYVTKYHMHIHQAERMKNSTFTRIFNDIPKTTYYSEEQTFEVFMRLGECDARGRLGHDKDPIDHLDIFRDKYELFKKGELK